MKLEQYIHNKGQLLIIQDELIKELNGKIKILENYIDRRDKLQVKSDELIESQEKMLKLHEEAFAKLKELVTTETSLPSKSIWSWK